MTVTDRDQQLARQAQEVRTACTERTDNYTGHSLRFQVRRHEIRRQSKWANQLFRNQLELGERWARLQMAHRAEDTP